MAANIGSSFAEATAITRLSSHAYSANFVDDWCIGTVPHGGYVTSCFQKVASMHFKTTLSSQNQAHTILLHLEFFRRTREGQALFTVRDVKIGRQTSTLHISLSQDDKEEVAGYITNINMYNESGVSLRTDWSLHPPPLPVDMRKLALNTDENWELQPEMPYESFRKAVQKVRFYLPKKGRRTTRGIADEWVRLSTGENWTNDTLGFLCDMWPSVVEILYQEDNPYVSGSKSRGKKAAFWYPTLVLNLDIKKPLPEQGIEFLFVRVSAKKIEKGRYDLEVVICDETGDVLALSHQACLILSAARNLTRSQSKI